MLTECNPTLFEFAPVEGRQVVVAFDGGAITTDAGALLLGETDRTIRLTARFAACFSDVRTPELVEHEVSTLVLQRVVGIALGYEDLNGSGANARNAGMCVEYGALPSGSEDRVPDFGRSSALSSETPHTKLSLTDAMHKLNAGDRDRRIAKLLEPLHRSDTLLDTAMVLLNQVIEILRRPQLGLRRQ